MRTTATGSTTGSGRPCDLPDLGMAACWPGYTLAMAFLLLIIAAVLVIYGIMRIVAGEVLVGIALIVLGCLVGPGGYSIFGLMTPL